MPGNNIADAIIVVLVDDEDPEARMRMPFERAEEALELVPAADRRDDEVERRKLRGRHEP